MNARDAADPGDNAGVIAPPPLLLLSAIVIGALLDWRFPAYALTVLFSLQTRAVLGFLLVIASLGLTVPAIMAFRAKGTEVPPWRPSTALVTGGVFTYLRNPMYVGMILFMAGVSFLFAGDWMLVMTIAFAIVVHYGVIKREERYLGAKFGDDYRHYRRHVARYGIRLR